MLSSEKKMLLAEYQQQIADLSKVTDPIEREITVNEIVDRYSADFGFRQHQVLSHVQLFSNDVENSDETTGWDLSELVDLPSEKEAWLVPDIFRRVGLFTFVAEPKVGKTLVAGYALADSVIRTGKFLGLPCLKGRVLFYQCEEGLNTIKRRLESKGIERFNVSAREAINNNALRIERNFNIMNLAKLQLDINKYNPDVVIVDSFRMATSNSQLDENKASIAAPLYQLQNMIVENGLACILIHHTRKNAKGGTASAGSGSLAIAGANDGLFTLERKPKSDNEELILRTIPRNSTRKAYVLSRTKDKNTGYWDFVINYELDVDPRIEKLEKKVLRYLVKVDTEHNGDSKTIKEIEDFITVDDLEVLDSAIERLVESGKIIESKEEDLTVDWGFKLLYSVPEDSLWAEFERNNYPEHAQAEELLLCNTKEDVSALYECWEETYGSEFLKTVWNCITNEEKVRVLGILNPYKYAVGDKVFNREDNTELTITEVKPHFAKTSWRYFVQESSFLYEHDALSPMEVEKHDTESV